MAEPTVIAPPGLVLEARRVRAGYGRLLALDDVTFGVPRGSTVAVLGANGAGKSTLLAVLSGRLRPWRGEVRFDGHPVADRRPWDLARDGLCCIPEGGGLFHDLSVRDNLLLAGTSRADLARLDEVFDLFPVLAERRAQRAGTLSGGEKRMLALSRAVLVRPSVLLVDEPSLGLAPIVVDEVFAVLRRLRDQTSTSIVLVEQYVDRALAIADWAWVLTKGRVTYSGQAAGLAGSDTLHAAYLGTAAPEAATGNGAKRKGRR